MSRRTTITTTLAALALTAPAGAVAAPSADVAAHLEAHAVVDSSQALAGVHRSVEKAKRLVQRSEIAMKHAYAVTVAQGETNSATALDAAASFSASAQQQGENLQALVDRTHGSLKATAADALAQTARLEAKVVTQVADRLDEQKSDATDAQGDAVSGVGDAHAELTATVTVAADSDDLAQRLQARLDAARSASIDARSRLMEAVDALRVRTESDTQGSMTAAQESLSRSWSVDYEKTVSAGDGPVSVTATGKAHVGVSGGGRR